MKFLGLLCQLDGGGSIPGIFTVSLKDYIALLFYSFAARQGPGGGNHAAARHAREDTLHQAEPLSGSQQHPGHTQLHRWER